MIKQNVRRGQRTRIACVGGYHHPKQSSRRLRSYDERHAFGKAERDGKPRLAPDHAKARRSCAASHSGHGLSGRLCVRLAEPWGTGSTNTARLSARSRLAPSTRSHVERRLGTSQDASHAQGLRSEFRLSGWGLSESDVWTSRIWIFLRRPVKRSLSELVWPSRLTFSPRWTEAL